MLKSSFGFEIIVHGNPLKEYYHKGDTYVEGKEGTHFSLKMKNSSGHRVLFVPTIDGLSIMNGKEASFKSRGYIVNAYDSTTIEGWRTSDDKVSQFFFSSPEKSYAKKMDKGKNLGVIGCVVFKEKERVEVHVVQKNVYIPIIYPSYNHCCIHGYYGNCPSWYCNINGNASGGGYSGTYNSVWGGGSGGGGVRSSLGSTSQNTAQDYSPQAFASGSSNVVNAMNLPDSVPSAGLGTGFGDDKYSPVTTVDFDKEESPSEVFSIFYNTKENLEALGIEFRKPVYVTPSAFPNEDGYCKKPY